MIAWQQAIIWTSDGLFYWNIYGSLSLNEFMASSGETGFLAKTLIIFAVTTFVVNCSVYGVYM